MNKKYQVFISSTYEDLKVERSAVANTVLGLGCIPCGMEAFCSESEEQFEVIRKLIDMCDYYVLIIANRYGTINKKEGKSYTELEYEYACSVGIPVLAFLIKDGTGNPSDKKAEQLALFKTKVSANRMVSFWSNKDELSTNVAIALANAFAKNDRVGWIRSDENEAEMMKIDALEKENKVIKEELKQTTADLRQAKDEIESITSFNGELLYDQRPISIKYNVYGGGQKTKQITIKELFKIVSIHFINVSITENGLIDLLAEAIDKDNNLRINRVDLKKICNQFLALGLFKTTWNNERKKLFYELTKKGAKIRDELNLYIV